MPNTLKSRWWWFICYPDSLPLDWVDIILQKGVPFIVSPLHDKDLDINGQFKKPHYHVIVIFENPTTYNHVLNHCCKPLCATIPQVILQLQGAILYLSHEGIPTKAQYDKNSIVCYNGSHIYLHDNEYVNDVYCAIESIIRLKRPKDLLTLIDLCCDIQDALPLIRSKPYYFASLLR